MTEQPHKTDLAKPKRRWLRFSLRTLLLTAAIAAWFAWQVNRAQKQRAAVAAIRKAGGEVMYDWMSEHQTSRYNSGMELMPWDAVDEWEKHRPRPRLSALLGNDYFQRVLFVNMNGEYCPDVQNIPDVMQLTVDNVTVIDADLQQLQRLSSLEDLSLSGCTITGRNLEDLKQLKQLKSLGLSRCTITGGNLEDLKQLKQLKLLSFLDTNVTEADADKLRAALPDCEVVVYVNPVPEEETTEKAFGEPTFELLPVSPQAAPRDDMST